jgi:hypothetical protein
MIQYLSQSKSDSKYETFFRTIEKKSPQLSYIPNVVTFNCHDGQRKLLYSEIEFYTLLSQKYSLDEILVVYAGSGEGLHMSIIFEMFPQLDFILIDPIKSLCDHPRMKNKERVKMMIEYYTDETYKKILEINTKKKKIVFMSDIREDTDESEIWKNMLEQQLWTIQLNAIGYLLKFRLPYLYEDIKINDFRYTSPIETNQHEIKLKDTEVMYLKGDIYLQIYPPLKSTETRLIYIRDPNEFFSLQSYDISIYENQCFYFNQISRKERYEYKESKKIKENIIGYDDSYESVCEYYLIDKYFEDFYEKNKKNVIFSNKMNIILQKEGIDRIVHFIYFLNHELIYMLNKDNITCKMKTFSKSANFKKILNDKDRQEYVIKYVIFNYLQTIQSLKNQIQFLYKSSILTSKEKTDQFNLLYDILHNFHNYIKNILQQFYKNKNNLKKIWLEEIPNREEVIYAYLTSQNNDIISIDMNSSIFLLTQTKWHTSPQPSDLQSYQLILISQLNEFVQKIKEYKEKSEKETKMTIKKMVLPKMDYYML